MIRVLHNKKAFDGDLGLQLLGLTRTGQLVRAVGQQPMAEFEHVADVDTDDLDVAYQQTNHIDGPWSDNDGVHCVRESRSTSIADVMERRGRFYVVAGFGFEELPKKGD